MRQNLERSKLVKSEIEAKIDVSCVNCNFKDKRDWQGCIVDKGFHRSVYAFFTKIKHKNKLLKGSKRLIRLLNICDDFCIEPELDYKPDQDYIFSFKGVNKISAGLVLSFLYIDYIASAAALIRQLRLSRLSRPEQGPILVTQPSDTVSRTT